MKLIILDAGHAEKVPGKEAPDLSFREWKFNNEMQYLLKAKLEKLGFEVYLTNPSPQNSDEIGLTTRANKANTYWRRKNKPKALFLSIHANAFLNRDAKGRYIFDFTSARGPVAFIAKNASNSSKKAATIFQQEISATMKQIDPTGNYQRGVLTQNFTVIYKTQMPSILMEYAFFTNRKDLQILNNNKEELAEATVRAFCQYFGIDENNLENKTACLRVIYNGRLNVRSEADWNSPVIMTVKKGDAFTIDKKVHAKNGSTMMYRLKSGVYITASPKYVEVFYK